MTSGFAGADLDFIIKRLSPPSLPLLILKSTDPESLCEKATVVPRDRSSDKLLEACEGDDLSLFRPSMLLVTLKAA